MARLAGCLLLFLPSMAAANVTLTGVLYGSQGGSSAAGTGTITLGVGSRVYQLAYQDPFPRKFADRSCWIAGSLWTVRAVMGRGGEGRLLRAECGGQKDGAKFAAVSTVGRCLAWLGERQFREAYDLFSDGYRKETSFEKFVSEVEHLDLRLYRTHRQDQCLEITERSARTRVHAGLECYIGDGSGTTEIDFWVAAAGVQSQVRIDAMKIE